MNSARPKGISEMKIKTEFYRGAPPASPVMGGPSRWPYLKIERSRTPMFEPALPVVLFGPQNWCKTTAILDSGADSTAIPYEWAGLLGVNLEDADSATAVANGVEAEYLKPRERIRCEVAGQVVDLEPYFGPWPHLALGRDLFKALGHVTFDEHARTVIIDPYDP